MDSSDAGTVYEEPVESYYSQMSDVEIVTNQGGGPPPRLVPLPPVPAQRKTKSTADIHMYLTDNEWRPRVGPRHKLSLPSPHDPRGPEHTASLNALSTTARRSLTRSMHSDSRDQQYTQPTLRYRQWPDANVVNRHTDGSIRNSDIINPDSFARTRLTRSTGSRNRVPADQSLNWLRASRRKLERSFDWLRRTARRNGRSPASSQKTGAHGMTTNEKQDSLMSKQLKLQEEEEYRRMQGPELPRPQIVLVPKLTSPTESTNNFKLRHEYLPMQNDVFSGGFQYRQHR
ncbi:unnamed protein product [Echinostoma caproni]|uniref:Spermatogenesis associated 6 n=1 Tax=Echinostoma caproni TaxID=27848 RepID=A0A183A8D8_9TREM|nr:unnamed protein product [Echinostoma caproni]